MRARLLKLERMTKSRNKLVGLLDQPSAGGQWRLSVGCKVTYHNTEHEAREHFNGTLIIDNIPNVPHRTT